MFSANKSKKYTLFLVKRYTFNQKLILTLKNTKNKPELPAMSKTL